MAQVTFPPGAGGGGGGGAVTVADGADVTQGAIADAAVTSDAAGTLSAKIRGLVAILADVWDNASNLLRVAVSGNVTIVDGGGSITVDGSVSISGTVPVTDNGGSITIDDGGGSITVDGTLSVTTFPPTPTVIVHNTGQTAPGAGTVIADTGALAAGNYYFHIEIGAEETENIRVQHRDSTNASNLSLWTVDLTASVRTASLDIVVTLAANERIRVVNTGAGGGGILFTASIYGGSF